MQKATFALALVSFMLSAWALLRPIFPTSPLVPVEATQPVERIYPPLILVGSSWLECAAAPTRGGRLVLHMTSGQGFDFNTPLLPLKKPKVSLQGAALVDEFNAFPAATIATCLKGIGDGTITAMKVEIWFNLRRYHLSSQSKRNIHFDVAASGSDPPYIELTGIFVRRVDGKRFPFRVVFGRLVAGGGDILASTFDLSQNLSQSMHLGSPAKPATAMTSLYEMEDDVRTLKLN